MLEVTQVGVWHTRLQKCWTNQNLRLNIGQMNRSVQVAHLTTKGPSLKCQIYQDFRLLLADGTTGAHGH